MKQEKEHVNISTEWQAFKWQGQYLKRCEYKAIFLSW